MPSNDMDPHHPAQAPSASHHGAPDGRVFCLRGPSRSGKTSMAERLIAHLTSTGLQVGYIKRTHHDLDLPHKASGRVWAGRPGAMLIHAADRLQLTLPPAGRDIETLVRSLPATNDVILVETHTPERYPTFLAANVAGAPGEDLLGRWSLETIESDAVGAAATVRARLPRDIALHRALREAAIQHGGHACAGLTLGTRLALYGTQLLGVEVPDRKKRLITAVEIDRCAADAIQAVTGCRPGKRTLRLLDYGKLAATFIDSWENRALRLAVRGDLREVAARLARPGEDRHEAQKRVYLSLGPADLFTVRAAAPDIGQFDAPGPPRRRVRCAGCGEEVSDGRDVMTDGGPRCRPCAGLVGKGVEQPW